MQFYTYLMDKASRELCTIGTPFGMFRYRKLPMGLTISPDIAQETMKEVLGDLPDVEVYVNDIGIFSDTWEDHMVLVEQVLLRLQDAGFCVNPLKCEWAVRETDFLGYWMTPTGLRPWKKKIEAILAMKRPSTVTQLRSFIGAVNFYKDMFRQRAHHIAPLTAMIGNDKRKSAKLAWTPGSINAFESTRAMLARDAILKYPDPNKPFHVYTDASDYQIGGAIFQDGQPVAYFSKKLTPAQKNYTVTEKELLGVVETLREYRVYLLGCRELHV